ncbi:MAG TPA: hypothetical protein VIG45_06890 [Erysipelothrix sp.]
MVKKIAFIVEGDTEKIIIESDTFKNWIKNFNLELIDQVINATGGGNLLPDKIEDMIYTLKNQGAEHIFILADLELAPSIQSVKDKMEHPEVKDIFITVVALESWFLACSSALGKWLQQDEPFFTENPEDTSLEMPFERIRKIGVEVRGRGISNKVALAKTMINHHGFNFEEILAHPNCSSLKYIERVLKSLNNP